MPQNHLPISEPGGDPWPAHTVGQFMLDGLRPITRLVGHVEDCQRPLRQALHPSAPQHGPSDAFLWQMFDRLARFEQMEQPDGIALFQQLHSPFGLRNREQPSDVIAFNTDGRLSGLRFSESLPLFLRRGFSLVSSYAFT